MNCWPGLLHRRIFFRILTFILERWLHTFLCLILKESWQLNCSDVKKLFQDQDQDYFCIFFVLEPPRGQKLGLGDYIAA